MVGKKWLRCGAILFGAVLVLHAEASGGTDLLVSSHWSAAVLQFDARTGAFVKTFASVARPQGIAYGPDGTLYLVSSITDQVLHYKATGEYLGAFNAGAGQGNGAAFGPDGNLYLGVGGSWSGVRCFDARTGTLKGELSIGNQVQDLAFGPDGSLYIASANTDSVFKVTYDGSTWTNHGTFASLAGSSPTGMIFGPDGNMYMTNHAGDNIVRFNGQTGAYMGVFASGGGLDYPYGLAFGPDADLRVTSLHTNQVLRYDGTSGAFEGVFASGGGMNQPTRLAFSPVPAPGLPAVLVIGAASVFIQRRRVNPRRR